jgi:hypothetical protein
MRTALLIAALACASMACVDAYAENGKESRYGPAPERAPTPVNGRGPGYTGAPYAGRALGWSGKREIVAPQAQAAAQVQPWWARQAQQAPQPQQAPTARTAYQPPAPSYAPQAPQAPRAALPRSIYDAPAPQAAPVPAAYSAPTQPAPQFRDGQIGARTYSVGRQFGMAPDPIPAAGPPRMVLITAPPALDEDKPREEGTGEWSAKPEKDSGQ